jgi:hypothetical protein
MENVIAERTISAVDGDGNRLEIVARIGQPCLVECGFADWACKIELNGLHEDIPNIWGTDSWQALHLANRWLKVLLKDFHRKGGKLLAAEPDPCEISVEELFLDQGATWPDPELSVLGRDRVNELSPAELHSIDDAILGSCSKEWRKVARIVGSALISQVDAIPNVPDLFYAERIRKLVEEGKLESKGDLAFMHLSEVRSTAKEE